MDALFENELINSDDDLPKHVTEMIEKGRADIEAGRFITMEEFVKRLTIYNDNPDIQ
jgi:predicted transcriptional regulator